MVPGGAKLRRLELVAHGLTRGNWALGYARNTICATTVQLANAMEVHCSAVLCQAVLDIYHEHVAPLS